MEAVDLLDSEVRLEPQVDPATGAQTLAEVEVFECEVRRIDRDKRIIVERSDVATVEEEGKSKRTVGTVALVKAREADRQTGTGTLLLFGPSGSPIVPVADGVRALHVAALSGNQITVLYERDRQLIVALFDATSLAKQQEQAMPVPPFK